MKILTLVALFSGLLTTNIGVAGEQGIYDLLKTYDRTVDFDGDGLKDFKRFYWPNKELRKVIYRPSFRPGLKEITHYNVDGRKLKLLRYKKKELVYQESYKYEEKQIFSITKTYLKSNPIHRVIIKPRGLHQTEILENWDGANWNLIKSSKTSNLAVKEFATCPEQDLESSCDTKQVAVSKGALAFLKNRLGPVMCKQDKVLVTPNGYRIDLESCSEESAREIARAAENVNTAKIGGCLSKLNKNLAAKMQNFIAHEKPLIRCGETPQKICKQLRAIGANAQQAQCQNLNGQTAGFTIPNEANRSIFLTQMAPGMPNYSFKEMVSTLTHETLHHVTAAGKHHNHAHHSEMLDDAVYGCEKLCAGNGENTLAHESLTYKGCTSCLQAEDSKQINANQYCAPLNN